MVSVRVLTGVVWDETIRRLTGMTAGESVTKVSTGENDKALRNFNRCGRCQCCTSIC